MNATMRAMVLAGVTVVPPRAIVDLVGYIARGEIRPLLAATYPLAELRAAQEAFLQESHVGDIVVAP